MQPFQSPAMALKPLPEPVTFRAHRRYWLLAGAGYGVATLFARELLRAGSAPELVFFFIAALWIALWYTRSALTTIGLSGQRLTFSPPLYGARTVDFRQLISVSQDGRLFDVLVVIYHPLQENGLLDLDGVRSLNFPAVAGQDVLYSFLQERAAG